MIIHVFTSFNWYRIAYTRIIESIPSAGYTNTMSQTQQKPPQKSNVSSSLQALALIGVLLGIVVGVFTLGGDSKEPTPVINQGTAANQNTSGGTAAPGVAGKTPTANQQHGQVVPSNNNAGSLPALDPDAPFDPAIEPAKFNSAAEALEAVLRAAASDDGSLLDRFADLPADTPWLKELSNSLMDLVRAPGTEREKKQYLANILGISGQPENTKFLFDELAKAKSDEDVELYATAIDLTGGPVETTQFLGSALDSDNQNVKTAALSALTNQDSPEAVQLVYNHTLKAGNPELGMEQGVGFSEMIPDEKTMPFFTDVLSKADDYAILAVRPLARSGDAGVSKILDVTLQHRGQAFEDKVINQLAMDLDEDTQQYLTKVKNDTSNKARAELADKILEKLKQLDAESLADSPSELESMVSGDEGAE